VKRTLIVAGVGAVALIAGACGGGSKASPAKASSKSTQATVVGAANPNAPEVSPTGDIPDNQAYVVYTPPSAGFSVKVPEGWARSEQAGAVVFTDKLNSIRTETVVAASAPTVTSAEQTAVPAIRASVKNLDRAQVSEVTRKAGTAVLITYGADSNPDPVTGKVRRLDVQRYEFWRNGAQVILTLTAPQGADNVDPWRVVTDSFGWL
jgi:hypothetical protein